MAELFIKHPHPPQIVNDLIRVELPCDSPFCVDGGLSDSEITAFNPDIKTWLRETMLEDVYLSLQVSREEEGGLEFAFLLHFESLNDATLFKLKWM
jgi:hypothetical protein